MVSGFVAPDNAGLADVFAPVSADLVLVKNGAGQVYWPAYGINQIGAWNQDDGYQVYIQANSALLLTGTRTVPSYLSTPSGSSAHTLST